MSAMMKSRIVAYMEETMDKIRTRHKEIRDIIGDTFRTTMITLMDHLYHPIRGSEGYIMEEGLKADLVSIEVGLFWLYVSLMYEADRNTLTQEGLVDFVVCLPWCLPQDSRPQQQATELVAYLSRNLQLQPPSLLNLTKAKLASMHFGLRTMLCTHSLQDLLQ